MNHLNKAKKLGGSSSQVNSMIRNMAIDLINYEHLTTTRARANAVIPFVERIINQGLQGSNHSKRLINSKLNNIDATNKVIEVFAKRFKNDDSGWVREYKLGVRKGDGAQLIKLMLKGFEPEIKTKLKKVKDEKKPSTKTTKATKANRIPNDLKQDQVKMKDQVSGADKSIKSTSRSGI